MAQRIGFDGKMRNTFLRRPTVRQLREARTQIRPAELPAIVDGEQEQGWLARKRRFGRQQPQTQSGEIAIRMQHRHHGQAREQECEQIAERVVVVDGADQHDQRDRAESQALTGGQDVHSPTIEYEAARHRRRQGQ